MKETPGKVRWVLIIGGCHVSELGVPRTRRTRRTRRTTTRTTARTTTRRPVGKVGWVLIIAGCHVSELVCRGQPAGI